MFFKRNKEFVNGTDRETGNTALHVASRHGHQVSGALYVIEQSCINKGNVGIMDCPGCF